MAHGKETPRQKMIGMMYLVLTCLLAMNVSKDILKGFVTVNESLERTNKNFSDNSAKLMEAMQASIDNGHPDVKPYYVKATEATKLTSEVFAYISRLKSNVQQYTEDVVGADTMKLRYIEKKDDYDKPTYYLIGDNEHSPKTDPFSARDLRARLSTLSDKLMAMVDKMYTTPGIKLPKDDYTTLKQKIKSLSPVDPDEKEDDVPVTWEIQNFNQLPLAAVITNLSKMQSDVKNIEAEVISTFAAASGKLSVKIDTLQPRIIPHSSYVLLGQPYKADVFLAASSSDFKEENLQMVLGDFDKNTASPGNGAQILSIENGSGKIQLPSTSVGHKTYKGSIKFKDGNGIYKYFNFEDEYIVAQPSVSVSPEKMNVFYVGVPNPISVSAAGVAPEDLVVKIDNGKGQLINKGNGKYDVVLTSPGDCNITVSAKTNEGIRPQGQPIKFRAKSLPTPLPKVAGKSGNARIDIAPLDLQNMNFVGTELLGFDFDAKFTVVSFTVGIDNKNGYKEFDSKDLKIPDAAKAEIAKCRKSNRIFFENIKALGPDKKIYSLPPITFKVK